MNSKSFLEMCGVVPRPNHLFHCARPNITFFQNQDFLMFPRRRFLGLAYSRLVLQSRQRELLQFSLSLQIMVISCPRNILNLNVNDLLLQARAWCAFQTNYLSDSPPSLPLSLPPPSLFCFEQTRQIYAFLQDYSMCVSDLTRAHQLDPSLNAQVGPGRFDPV